MLYNKRKFTKVKDKKILHKVGKHWVTLSISALLTLGGFAFTQTTSHADTINSNQTNSNQILKDRINTSLKQSNTKNDVGNEVHNLEQKPQVQTDNSQINHITNQQDNNQNHFNNILGRANSLHRRILSNALLSGQNGHSNQMNKFNSNNSVPNNKVANSKSTQINKAKDRNRSAETVPNNQDIINSKNNVATNNNQNNNSSSKPTNLENNKFIVNSDRKASSDVTKVGSPSINKNSKKEKVNSYSALRPNNTGANSNVYLNPNGTMSLLCKTVVFNQDGTTTNQNINTNGNLTPFTFGLTTGDAHDILSEDHDPSTDYLVNMVIKTDALPEYINMGNGKRMSIKNFDIRVTGANVSPNTLNSDKQMHLRYNPATHGIEYNDWLNPATNTGSLPYLTVNLVAKNATPKITVRQAIFDSGDNTNLDGSKGKKGSPMHWVTNSKGQRVLSDMKDTPNLYNADNSIKKIASIYPGQAFYNINIPASDNLLRPYDEIGNGVKIPDNLLDTNNGRKIDLSRIQNHSDCILDTQDFSDNLNGTIYKYQPNTENPQPNNLITSNNQPLILPYLKYSGNSGLIVHFINQNNTEVSEHLVTAPQGTQVEDITDTADGGVPVPRGYTLNSDQNVTYRLERYSVSAPGNIYLRVTGKPQANTININRIIKKSDGTVTNDEIYNYKLDPKLNRVGNTIVLDPSDNDIQPSGYIPDGYSLSKKKRARQAYNQDEDISIGDNLIDPSSITFYYHSIDQDSAPVYSYYINQDHNIIGKAFVTKGHVGDTVNLLNNNPVPYGYNLTNSDKEHANVTLTNSPQVILYNVKGNTYPYTGTNSFLLHLIFKDADGHITKLQDVPIRTRGEVGDEFFLNPYHFKSGFDKSGKQYSNGYNKPIVFNGINGKNEFNLPSDYHAAASDMNIGVSITNNGDLVPTRNADFTYIHNFDQPKVGQVNVHYIASDLNNKNDSDGNTVNINGKNYHELDVESDRGVVNQDVFNVQPYLDDLPELVNKYYDINNNKPVMYKNGNEIPEAKYNEIFDNNDKQTYNSGTTDIYINLSKKGDEPIYL